MRNFAVNVVSEREGGKVPVFLAGQVMVDVQQILMDVGEYITARELRIQKAMSQSMLSKFILYMGADGSVSTDTSVDMPEVEGYGNIVDDALELTERTMDALGSGVGGYWMEDNFADPFYRSHIIYDLVALSEHMSEFPDCTLMYGSEGEPKKFGRVDVQKMAAFLKEKGNTGNGATLGILSSAVSKSKGVRYTLECAGDKARVTFADEASEKAAAALVGKGPVFIGGTIVYGEDGTILEIRNAGGAAPAESISFRRLVAGNGDIKLANPVKASISYNGEKWKLYNEGTGISVAQDTWDATVQVFHDQMVFLWTEYMDDSKELEGEEAEVRDYFRSLIQ